MLTLTKSAWKRISRLKTKYPHVSNLRLMHEDGTVRCRKGVQKPNDQIITKDGHPSVLLQPAVAEELNEYTLHAPKTDLGHRLRLKKS